MSLVYHADLRLELQGLDLRRNKAFTAVLKVDLYLMGKRMAQRTGIGVLQ
jgi:hypothetical protein